jgi:hypothetical protein
VAVLELCDFAGVGVVLARLVPGSDHAVHLECAAGIVGAGGLGSAGGSAYSRVTAGRIGHGASLQEVSSASESKSDNDAQGVEGGVTLRE